MESIKPRTELAERRMSLAATWSVPFVVAATALSIVAAGDNVLPGDQATARAIQDAGIPGAAFLTDLGNWLGSTVGVTGVAVVLALGLLVVRHPRQAALAVAVVLLRRLNPVLKEIFDSPRPTPDLIRVTEFSEENGFPSGHAMGTTLLYGMVIYLAIDMIDSRPLRRAIQVVAVVAVLITGYARINTGAHWPTDVIGGYLWGTALILLLVGAVAFARARRL